MRNKIKINGQEVAYEIKRGSKASEGYSRCFQVSAVVCADTIEDALEEVIGSPMGEMWVIQEVSE